jgi:hypothetical protein
MATMMWTGGNRERSCRTKGERGISGDIQHPEVNNHPHNTHDEYDEDHDMRNGGSCP